MSAPQSVHQDSHAALLEVYQILRGAALRARERQPHEGGRPSDSLPDSSPVDRETAVAPTTTASERRSQG